MEHANEIDPVAEYRDWLTGTIKSSGVKRRELEQRLGWKDHGKIAKDVRNKFPVWEYVVRYVLRGIEELTSDPVSPDEIFRGWDLYKAALQVATPDECVPKSETLAELRELREKMYELEWKLAADTGDSEPRIFDS